MHMRDCADFTVLIHPSYFVVSVEKKKELQVYLLSTLGQLQVYLLWLLGRSDAAPPYNRCKIGRIGTRVMQLVCNQSKQDPTS